MARKSISVGSIIILAEKYRKYPELIIDGTSIIVDLPTHGECGELYMSNSNNCPLYAQAPP
jgi:hypothetical protein